MLARDALMLKILERPLLAQRAGTQFTCFTGTKSTNTYATYKFEILERPLVVLTCFDGTKYLLTGTKVQILTRGERADVAAHALCTLLYLFNCKIYRQHLCPLHASLLVADDIHISSAFALSFYSKTSKEAKVQMLTIYICRCRRACPPHASLHQYLINC
jgi:hypothetical protein